MHSSLRFAGALALCEALFFTSPQPLAAQDFILPMGYDQPWTGKLLFNSEGGYNTGGTHAWEQLYEAQPGDVYTITMPTACYQPEYGRVQFKTPITLLADHTYRLLVSLTSDKDISGVNIALCENEDDDICLANATGSITANKKITFTRSKLTGTDIEDAKIALEFPTTEDNTVITISGISIYDTTESRELWTGTSFYNWCFYADESGGRIEDMQIDGRTETLSWTLPDFDDSLWAEALMPIGSWGAIDGVQTEWPGGNNTNFWFRRNFTLEEVDSTSRYMLHVLHDDSYRIWVNGQQLDEAENWTIGTEAVKLEIPADLLNVGNNVIAAYVQQNWGGKLYDCGLTVEPDFYENGDPDGDPRRLVINEVQVGNIDQYIDFSYNYGAWIEIYNPTQKNILLDGMYVSDDKDDPYKFKLPTGIGVVKAGDFKVLYFDHNSADGTFGDTAYKQVRFKLQNDGGTIYLFDQEGELLASADYPECIPRCSWARKQDGSNEWGWTGEPSLEASNNDSEFADFRLEAPTIDTDSRLFSDPFSIQVTIPEGATLRYTTDGTTPSATNGSTSEDGIFNISETTVYRFGLFQEGMLPSPVVTRSFIYRTRSGATCNAWEDERRTLVYRPGTLLDERTKKISNPKITLDRQSMKQSVANPASSLPSTPPAEKPKSEHGKPPGTGSLLDQASAQDGATDNEPKIGYFRRKCEIVSNQYLLSARETEVLFYLAKGYNSAYLQEKLFISEGTAKTHIRHIYGKTNVHSQQELMRLVNEIRV